jgi:hypothetical protein
LADLAKVYLLDQLNIAATYGRARTLLAGESRRRRKARTDPQVQELREAVQILAYRCVLQADAWESLSAELHIEPDALVKDLPGYDTVCRMVKTARVVAFTKEEATAYLSRAKVVFGGGEYRIETAEEVVQAMREILQERFRAWS